MNGEKLLSSIAAHAPLTIDHVDGPHSKTPELKSLILNRGL